MLALIELLDWYLTQAGEGFSNSGESVDRNDEPLKRPTQRTLVALLTVGVPIASIYILYFRLPANHPIHKSTKVETLQHDYMKVFSKRHFLTMQLVSQFTNKFGQDDEMVSQSLTQYRTMIADYNMNRGVYRQDLQLIFGDEVYLFEREVHNELFYANKNLECMIHKGDSQELAKQEHLKTANEKHRDRY